MSSTQVQRFLLHSGAPVASPFGTYVRAADYDSLVEELARERAKAKAFPSDIPAAIEKIFRDAWKPLNPGDDVPACAQMIDGRWHTPVFGCDAVDNICDELKALFPPAPGVETGSARNQGQMTSA